MLNNNNNNLQAFQLIVFARYPLGVPKPYTDAWTDYMCCSVHLHITGGGF